MSEKLENSKPETRSSGARREVLGVVMARGGSVGLPGKALRELLERPVIAYTLEHVRESRLITRSVVSSDDEGILEVAKGMGFEVILRPGELATSASATDPVLRHAVRELRSNSEFRVQNSEFEAVVMLYGNVPVRRGGMIDRCVEMLFESGCDSVQTIAAVGKMHPYWMFDLSGEGRIKKHVANEVFRRQDLPALYSPTGAVYVMRMEVLMGAEGSSDPHAFLGVDRRGLVVGVEDSVDIDTERDLWVAEAMLRWQSEKWKALWEKASLLQIPEWVTAYASMPAARAFARADVNLQSSRLDQSYLEFLETQIKLEPRGPEWTQIVRRRQAC